MRVLTVASQKGGVGKTSLVQNLGYELAQAKQRVLMIDLDPQADLTLSYDIHVAKDTPTIYHALRNPDLAMEAMIEVRPNLHLMPASMDLSAAEVNFAADAERQYKLANVVEKLRDLDFVIIDAPPSLGFFTLNSLVAANELIIPLQCSGFAWKALEQLFEIMKKVQSPRLNPNLKLLGIALTFFDTRNRLSKSVIKQAKDQFRNYVFKTPIPINVRVAEAPMKGLAVAEHEKKSSGARAYRKLAREVLNG